MHLARFFDHWGLSEDPFRAEEARQDAVFRRLGSGAGADAGAEEVSHPDFGKIAGDADSPATAIVFGEKGSGKTAIRMQIERRTKEHNQRHPDRRTLLIAYDDLNPLVDRIAARAGRGGPAEAFNSIRLTDHMDGILRVAVTAVVDSVLDAPATAVGVTGGGADVGIRRADLKALDGSAKQDLLALQAVYDASDRAATRTVALRRALGVAGDHQSALWGVLAALTWGLPAAVAWGWWRSGLGLESKPWLIAMGAALALAALATLKRVVWDPGALRIMARRALSNARSLSRGRESVAQSLRALPPMIRDAAAPQHADADHRFGLFRKLRRAMAQLGCPNVLVVVDRVDEPTLVSGDADRMRALVWPLLNNKFLQMEGFGIKLLLPIELRYALFRETTAFFQESRLDKQSLIERLNWTGATLYDLCTARLHACLKPGAERISLRELFEDDVTRQDVADALEQVRRPRDAFKLLYRCIQEHCASVSEEEPKWKIPRVLLETVKKREQERVEQLGRGVRPA